MVGERDSNKRQLDSSVVEDMMEEEDASEMEHAHKRGRHEQPWREVMPDVEPRPDKSESRKLARYIRALLRPWARLREEKVCFGGGWREAAR